MKRSLLVSSIILVVFFVGLFYLIKNTKHMDEKLSNNYITEEQSQENETGGGFSMTILKNGEGEKISSSGSSISVNYIGYYEDGSIFDSNLDSGQTFDFTLGSGQVIEGWEFGLVDMKEGEVRRLVIPSEYAYGDTGFGEIPPKATLIFDVELVSIN